jgi:hypothetical protein
VRSEVRSQSGRMAGLRSLIGCPRALVVMGLLTLPWMATACTSGTSRGQAAPTATHRPQPSPSFRLLHLYKNSALVPDAIAKQAPFLPGDRLAFATTASTGCEPYRTRLLAASAHRWVFAMKGFNACFDDLHWAVPIVQLVGTTPDLTRLTRIVLRYPGGRVETLTCQPGGKPCRRTSRSRVASTRSGNVKCPSSAAGLPFRAVGNCSFCGKSERQGVRLVRGPDVAICEECVRLAHDEILPGMPETQPAARRQVSFEAFGEPELGGTSGQDAE